MFWARSDQVGNDDIHKSLDEFEIWPNLTTDYRVSCPSASKKSMSPLFLGHIGQIHFKFVGKENMHNIWNEFEFRPDPTTDFRVICP